MPAPFVPEAPPSSFNVVSTFIGNISNFGTITAKTGVDILGSTITGAIVDSGVISATHGILIDNASKIDASRRQRYLDHRIRVSQAAYRAPACSRWPRAPASISPAA